MKIFLRREDVDEGITSVHSTVDEVFLTRKDKRVRVSRSRITRSTRAFKNYYKAINSVMSKLN